MSLLDLDEVCLTTVFAFLTSEDVNSTLLTSKTFYSKNLDAFFRNSLEERYPDLDLPYLEDKQLRRFYFSDDYTFQVRLLSYWRNKEEELDKHRNYLHEKKYTYDDVFKIQYLSLLPARDLGGWKCLRFPLPTKSDAMRDWLIAKDDPNKYLDYFKSVDIEYVCNERGSKLGPNMVEMVVREYCNINGTIQANYLAKYFIANPKPELFDRYFKCKGINPAPFLLRLEAKIKDNCRYILPLNEMKSISNTILLTILGTDFEDDEEEEIKKFCKKCDRVYAKVLLLRYSSNKEI